MADSEGPHGGDQQERSLFQLAVENATDFAIFTTDLAGIVTSWNAGAERLTGFRSEDIVGQSSNLIFTPEDRAAGEPEFEREQALKNERAEDERWHVRQSGQRFWGSGLMMRMLQDGRPSGFVKVVRDRTERHKADQQLRASEERFRLLATSIPQLVFRTLGDGNRTWGSPQWVDFTGLSDPASRGLGWLDAIHPDDRELTREAWKTAQERGEYHVEHRVLRVSDGEYRWHQTRARPINGDDADSDWVGTSSDIHDLRTLQDRQHVLLAELQHRTRNLLAVVQAISRQTQRSSGSFDEFSAEFEDRLRALSRVQGMLARTDHEVIDLRTLVESELAAHLQQGSPGDKISIDGPHAPLPSASLQALALAVHELVTNAVKYGALGQPAGKLGIDWELRESKGAPHVLLNWRETGVRLQPPDGSRRKGYGTELIQRALPYQLGAETSFEFKPDGVFCRIVVPIARPDVSQVKP